MKVLFIAYHFTPFKGVGAKRVSYWSENLKKSMIDCQICDVITATEQNQQIDDEKNKNIDNVIFVPNKADGILKKIFKTDLGASWYKNLAKYIKDEIKPHQYDVAIITGDPFMHMLSLRLLKKKNIGCILDYRDPFSFNPRRISLNNSIKANLKRSILYLIEIYCNYLADKIFVVNKYCLKYTPTLFFDNREKIKIIENGYDEKYFSELDFCNRKKRLGNELSFGYAGKLYLDRNPTKFLEILKKEINYTFHHIGDPSEYLQGDFSNIRKVGVLGYSETVSYLKSLDILLIFTSGFDFESTTKVYDYIALGKYILIITNRVDAKTYLSEIIEKYKFGEICLNSEIEINKALKRIENKFKGENSLVYQFKERHMYSRSYWLNELVFEIRNFK